MSNRELLQKASKALGVDGRYIDSPEGILRESECGKYHWNPIIRTEQMLEMAIALQIDISNLSDCCAAYGPDTGSFYQDHNGDAMAAVRLAVTKCAASMWGGDNDAN
jgi:hypothetical protein